MNLNWSYIPETLTSGQSWRCFVHVKLSFVFPFSKSFLLLQSSPFTCNRISDGRVHMDLYVDTAFNTLKPRRNRRYNADDIFKCIFLRENVWIPTKISLKFVPKGPINNIPALVQLMAWRRPGDKPLSEPMMVSLLTQICVTRPQWVKSIFIWQFLRLITWTCFSNVIVLRTMPLGSVIGTRLVTNYQQLQGIDLKEHIDEKIVIPATPNIRTWIIMGYIPTV